MKDYIDCIPVMLPTADRQAPIWCNHKFPDNLYDGWYNMSEERRRHLYLVSEEEIKEGDWHISYLGSGGLLPTITKYDGVSHLGKDDKKVVAATNKSLSLPLIPYSLIEKWINERGKIDKVRIPTWQYDTKFDAVPRTDISGKYVIILPIEDKTFSREYVKALANEYAYYIDTNTVSNQMGFLEWFDKNYPI